MLKPEIQPFADHHIANLHKLEEQLVGLTDHDLTVLEQVQILQDAQRAFTRFKMCALDEWNQKERLQAKYYHCRKNHR